MPTSVNLYLPLNIRETYDRVHLWRHENDLMLRLTGETQEPAATSPAPDVEAVPPSTFYNVATLIFSMKVNGIVRRVTFTGSGLLEAADVLDQLATQLSGYARPFFKNGKLELETVLKGSQTSLQVLECEAGARLGLWPTPVLWGKEQAPTLVPDVLGCTVLDPYETKDPSKVSYSYVLYSSVNPEVRSEFSYRFKATPLGFCVGYAAFRTADGLPLVAATILLARDQQFIDGVAYEDSTTPLKTDEEGKVHFYTPKGSTGKLIGFGANYACFRAPTDEDTFNALAPEYATDLDARGVRVPVWGEPVKSTT